MNPLAAILFVTLAGIMLAAPRKWALAPFLAGCCLMTTGQGLDLGFISLPMFRLLILVGFVRAIIKGERIEGGLNAIDKLLMFWAAWYLFASFFHASQLDAGPVFVSGVIYNLLGFYFLVRIWCSDLDDTKDVIKIIALLLVPVAISMLGEKFFAKNLFSYFGGVQDYIITREGKIRAQGPFLHPILAGTVGATCIPLFVGIFRDAKIFAIIGIIAAIIMVFASASSGPIVSLMAAIFALGIWRYRDHTRKMWIGAIVTYLLLMVVMERPPYYLISKIDLSGGSTGFHRSFLFDQTLQFFNEWWLFGTDYTRHWMPDQGTASSPTHTDITNYYIGIAVGGGLLSLLIILGILMKSFGWVGQIWREIYDERPDNALMIWCMGSALFSHVVTGISVAYFDQSVFFYWLNVAVISSMYSSVLCRGTAEQDAEESGCSEVPARTFDKAFQ